DEVVVSRSDLEEVVFTVDVGGRFARGAVFSAFQRDGGVGNDSATRISNRATQRGRGLRVRDRSSDEQSEYQHCDRLHSPTHNSSSEARNSLLRHTCACAASHVFLYRFQLAGANIKATRPA